MKKLANQPREIMSVADYRAFKLSNPNEFDQLERDICAALQNRVNESDISQKYNVGKSVLVIIKQDNGLIFKGALAGASPQTIAARKLYERQCHAKGEKPLDVKEWRILFESGETTVRGGFDPNKAETTKAIVAEPDNVHIETKQLPLDFAKDATKTQAEFDPYDYTIDCTRNSLSVKFLHMLSANPRLAACLNALAEELYGSNSGKLVVEYRDGKPTSTVLEYKES